MKTKSNNQALLENYAKKHGWTIKRARGTRSNKVLQADRHNSMARGWGPTLDIAAKDLLDSLIHRQREHAMVGILNKCLKNLGYEDRISLLCLRQPKKTKSKNS